MEQNPADMDVEREIVKPESTEAEEMLCRDDSTESAETTDSSDKAIRSEDKSEISTTASEQTSGIEMGSESSTSVPESATSAAEKDAVREVGPLPLETSSDIKAGSKSVTSASSIPPGCEAESKLLSIESQPTSGIEIKARSLTSEIPSEYVVQSGTGSGSNLPTEDSADGEKVTEQIPMSSEPASVGRESACTTSGPEIPCEKAATLDGKKTKDSSAKSKHSSPTKFSKLRNWFSPPKKSKEKSGSKSEDKTSESMSPEKTLEADVGDKPAAEEEADIASGEKQKKRSAKGQSFKKAFQSTLSSLQRWSTKSSDSSNLVSEEEIQQSPEPIEKVQKSPAQGVKESGETECTARWAENDESPSEIPSYDGTTVTDIPSTWSEAEALPDDSRRSSEMGESIPEEAVSDLASPPNEQIDIHENDPSKDGEKKDGKGDSNLETGN